MTDEPRSRFTEDPGWVTPAMHYQHMVDIWPEARDADERALLASAIARRYFGDCTAEEKAVIRAIDARLGGTRVPL